jgi:hypothetical protein
MRDPNPDKLNDLMGKLLGDLGAAIAGASILPGDRLGLYKAMADGTPVTSSDLAKKTNLHERYLREWLSGQAASGYISDHPERAPSHSRLSKRWRSPKRVRPPSSRARSTSYRQPILTNPKSPRRSELVKASAGRADRCG